MKFEHSPDNQTMLRLSANILLNVVLIPFYICFLLISFVCAVSPLFPARTARENYKKRLGFGPLRQIFATTATLFHYVLIVLEDFVFWPLGLIIVRDNPTSRAALHTASQTARRNSVGVVVLSAHFGNIEITAQCVNSLLYNQVTEDKRLIALAKPSRSPFATRLLAWYRAKRGIEVVWTNRKDLVKTMILALRNGRALALLVDQKPASAGHFVEFFGAQSAFPEGGIEVAIRTNAEFIFIASRRLWPAVYTHEGHHYLRSAMTEYTTSHILAGYACWLEKVIRLSPWQWSWDYRKWSRQPKNNEVHL